MRELFDKIKTLVVYDADKEFYAKVFPDSVPRKDLFRIRRMTNADLPQVLAIERKNYPFPWEEDIFEDCLKGSYSCWVCEELDRVLGYCLLTIGAGEAHILNISVDPAEQKQGIGRKMLKHLIDASRGRAETIFLEVRPSNIVAIALYEDMGFNEIGIRKGYYPAENGREDAIMLALHLF
ncbi:MAG: ribosomal protein S18-alanine N-acetyltransferase [Methylovulum sp.]|uniref:ribosomal protein S18-alanine N-acetyltransferase n=1 Tax=Methylovulum sp. TaxID=1916980 RepID=UPI00260C37C0|nr:ribosomal protein S18-alanine N-acetyltransferase [Methylovulum sp.]MDD2723050.1 ribosomal protein S18-alanine N-acetyltransferase [Methylovulum sp.]MDD5123761.1 ribosomal protein S18-alanine N-acetyltransferase [Methylovulum sp.]